MSEVLAGDVIYAADHNDVNNGSLERPVCQLVQQTAQTGWTSATGTAVTFGASSEVIDSHAAHDTGSNTSRIVIGVKLGWWLVEGVYCPPSNSNTSLVRAYLALNGSFVAGSFTGLPFASTTALIGITTRAMLIEATSATDYVELFGYQTASGGTIGTVGLNTYVACSLTAVWQRESL